MSTVQLSQYTLLDSTHGLVPAMAVPQNIIQYIVSEMTGKALSDYLQFFNLGGFYIDADLLEQHGTQRELDLVYVDKLRDEFENGIMQRSENAGVVIGLGEGWKELKNVGGKAYRITKDCPLLSQLSVGGKIGQVIRGGHRTGAVRQMDESEQYWYYQVLLPSKCFILIYPDY